MRTEALGASVDRGGSCSVRRSLHSIGSSGKNLKSSRVSHYGVRECWLVDPVAGTIEVVDFSDPAAVPRLFDGADLIRSRVLPDLPMIAAAACAD